MLRGHPFATDSVLAFALAAFVLSEVFTSGDYLTGSRWVYVPVALLMTVPLAWRRRAPLAVAALVMGAFAAQSLILDPTPTPDGELIPALIAVYSVAANGAGWSPFVGGGVSLAAGLIWLVSASRPVQFVTIESTRAPSRPSFEPKCQKSELRLISAPEAMSSIDVPR